MYSLDINFLRDRPEYQPHTPQTPGPGIQVADRTALVAGVAAGVFPLAVVGGLWFFAQAENAKLGEELAKLEQDASTLSSQDQQVKAIQAEAAQIKAQRDGIASIFNTSIKPIVAILQDIRDRVPAGVQISQIAQTVTADAEAMKAAAAAAPAPAQTPPAAPAPGATPPANQPPAGQKAAAPPAASPPVPWTSFKQTLKIAGTARAFDDVNDFVLSLKQSDFLDADAIKLTKSELKENPLQQNVVLAAEFKNQTQNTAAPRVKLPDVVDYEIEVDVNKKLASEITPQTRGKGAIGLASRIETLKQKGVIQP